MRECNSLRAADLLTECVRLTRIAFLVMRHVGLLDQLGLLVLARLGDDRSPGGALAQLSR